MQLTRPYRFRVLALCYLSNIITFAVCSDLYTTPRSIFECLFFPYLGDRLHQYAPFRDHLG